MIVESLGPVEPGVFRERPNRFVVEAVGTGGGMRCLNTNTGRLGELLRPGARLLCLPKTGGRTSHRLVGVMVGGRVALVDTGLQMRVFERLVGLGVLPWLRGCRVASRSPRVGSSVLDYRLECGGGEVLVELKSAVLLHSGGLAGYPDCPSDRGARHLRELAEASLGGRARALVVFVAAVPGARGFMPYGEGDPRIPLLLERALEAGVGVRALGLEGLYSGGLLHVNLYSPNLPVVLP